MLDMIDAQTMVAEIGPSISNLMHEKNKQILKKHKIDLATAGRLSVGFACVQLRGEIYVPDPNGRWMMTVPVSPDSVSNPRADSPRYGHLVETPANSFDVTDTAFDIIAFDPREPRRWYFRRGYAALLGAEHMIPGASRNTFETPLEWLQNDGNGVVVLQHGFEYAV